MWANHPISTLSAIADKSLIFLFVYIFLRPLVDPETHRTSPSSYQLRTLVVLKGRSGRG